MVENVSDGKNGNTLHHGDVCKIVRPVHILTGETTEKNKVLNIIQSAKFFT